jgi:hypothetical protein
VKKKMKLPLKAVRDGYRIFRREAVFSGDKRNPQIVDDSAFCPHRFPRSRTGRKDIDYETQEN